MAHQRVGERETVGSRQRWQGGTLREEVSPEYNCKQTSYSQRTQCIALYVIFKTTVITSRKEGKELVE